MSFPTQRQARYIHAAPANAVLTACPGSGKTATAVERFIERCKKNLGYGVAYLSYTNVAVNEARRRAIEVGEAGRTDYPNLVTTIDSFFRNIVFDTFAYMYDTQIPRDFTVLDRSAPPSSISKERGVNLWDIRPKNKINNRESKVPLGCWDIRPYLRADGIAFEYKPHPKVDWKTIDSRWSPNILEAKFALLHRGYTTHADLLLFTYRLLADETKRAVEIVRRRFGELIVDEAQDTTELQQGMFSMLSDAGIQISYVGDAHQGIYTFNRANPAFLQQLIDSGRTECALNETFRSIQPIVDVLNARFKRGIRTKRIAAHAGYGAFTVTGDSHTAVKKFRERLDDCGISPEDAIIIAWGYNDLAELIPKSAVEKWRLVPRYSALGWQRERAGDMNGALEAMLRVFRSVVEASRWQEAGDSDRRSLAWGFLRGLSFPSPLDTETPVEWNSRLKRALSAYLDGLGVAISSSFSANTAKNNIPEHGTAAGLLSFDTSDIRTTVVHQVKGETITAVLIIATEEQHKRWLDVTGCGQEASNVFYVALSRAADLLVLECPTGALAAQWGKYGFQQL